MERHLGVAHGIEVVVEINRRVYAADE